MTQTLMEIPAERRIALVLEGGYNRSALAYDVEACVRVLLGEEAAAWPEGLGDPAEDAVEAVNATVHAHAAHWKCMAEEAARVPPPPKCADPDDDQSSSSSSSSPTPKA
jgi:hypothetical protein